MTASIYTPGRAFRFDRRQTSWRRRRGFALLITITLVAFLVLLLLSIASLTRVETQVATNFTQLSSARQNALTALQIALGQLQKYAGPDQRATARADLTAGVSNPYYAGVWDTTVAGATATNPLVWLVSGNENNGTLNPPATDISSNPDAVLLVDKGVDSQPALRVRVLKQSITATVPGVSGSATIGHFAYWVGDEGVKARANLTSPWPKAASTGATREREAGYGFAMAQRTGIEQVAREVSPAFAAGTPIGTNAYVPNIADLARVFTEQQLPLALPNSLGAAERNEVTAAYRHRLHDLTTWSVGVLSDQREGGLKRDLTRLLQANAAGTYSGVAAPDAAYLFDGSGSGANYFENPPSWGQLRSFAGTTSNGTAIAPRLPTATDQGIGPVLAWVEMGYAVGLNAAGTRVRMHLFPRILLWNPYNVPLADASYEIGIRGHEAHRITITATAPGTGTTIFNAGSSQFSASPGTTFLRFRIAASGVIPAGACRLYTLSTNTEVYSAGANLLSEGDRPFYAYVEGTTAIAADLTALTPLQVNHATPGVEAMAFIRQAGGGVVTGNSAPPLNYQFIGRVGVEVSGFTNSGGSQALGFTPDFRLSVRARLGGENNALPVRWVANGNPRAPHINRTHVPADLSRYNPLYNGLLTGNATPTPSIDMGVNRLFVNGSGSADTLVLFQVPRADTPLFGIADLRHANLGAVGTAPAYAIGTSLADFRMSPRTATTRTLAAGPSPNGAVNYPIYDYSYLLNQALWDRYFFSTVPSGLPAAYATDPDYAALPNGRLRFLRSNGGSPAQADLLSPVLAAKNLLLEGAFNVNSTSVQAWRAQLSSLNALAYDPVAGTEGGTALERPFSRFQRPLSGSSNAWSGFRELTSNQVNALAEAIVAEIRSRGPFLSLGQFVNRNLSADDRGLKGALQAAIDTVDQGANAINNLAPFTQDAAAAPATTTGYDLEALRGVGGASAVLPVSSRNAGAPGNLTQADLLAALGPTLAARSDTFIIRAYGDVQNPATDAIESRAWCEAVVQRLPDYVNASADQAEVFPPTDPINQQFGRKFEIVSFRWLSPEDI